MIQMTRKEYEAKYGIAPVISGISKLDDNPAPIQMTRAEYEARYGKKPEGGFDLFGGAKDAVSSLSTEFGGSEQSIGCKLFKRKIR